MNKIIVSKQALALLYIKSNNETKYTTDRYNVARYTSYKADPELLAHVEPTRLRYQQ